MTTWSNEIGVASDSMAAGIDGLATGDYDFKVRARNENGYGDYASVSSIHIESQAYDITNCQQLQAIQNDTDGAYTLAQDIDCAGTNQWNSNGDGGFEGFEPISNFSGTLDGNNYTISGLYINRPGSCGQGIFDTLQSGSVIQDLAINNLSLTASCDSAPLAAFADGGSTITNVSTSGSVAVSYGAGGIIGIAESEDEGDITVSDSASNVTFAASNEDNQQTVGGIVGYVNSYRSTVSLLNNQVTMNVSNSSANAYRIGGMTGGADLYDDGHLVIDGSEVDGAITAHSTLAGLVGEVDSSWSTMDDRPSLTITNSQVVMNMLGKGAVGGLVSYIEASGLDVRIENSSYLGYSEATENDNMGGLVGTMLDQGEDPSLTIESSYVRAELNGTHYIGGLVGNTDVRAAINNSYYQGTLTGGNWIGGLVGRGPVNIDHSYAAGAIDSSNGMQLGGLVGEMMDGLIADSFAAVSLNSNWLTVGGLIGAIDNGVVNAWVDADIAGSSQCNSVYNPEGIVDYNCNPVNQDGSDSEYFIGNSTNVPLDTWDFDTIWSDQNGEYPVLQTGDGEPTYEISNCSELQGMNNDLDGDYELVDDIDCSATANWDEGQGFLPIASGHMEGFTGTLDGNGYTISNLFINRPDLYYVGLFESLNGTQVASFNLVNANITGGQVVGGVVAMAYGAGIFDINVSNSTVTSVISYNGMEAGTGGIAGSLFADGEGMYGMAEDSFQGSVNGGYNVGGLVGIMGYNALFDSYAQADVTGEAFVGGLVGNAGFDYIVNSYASGSVTSTGGGEAGSWAGGLLGSGFELAIEDSFAASSVTTADDPAFGGGLIGMMDQSVQLNNTYFNSAAGSGHCGYDQYSANDYVDNEGCIAIDLADDPNYFFGNNVNAPLDQWDFEDVWQTNVDGYPTFIGQNQEPEIQCEEVTGTDTSVTISCISTPDTWGETTWEMQYQQVGDSDWITVELDDPSLAQATITGLTPGTEYRVQFRFTNDWGTSDWGYIPYTTTGSKPSAPIVTKQATKATIPTSVILPSAIIQQVTDNPEEAKTILDDFSEYTIGKSIEFELTVGQVIYFYVGGELHSATVKEIGKDYVILTIASTPFDVRLNVGEAQEVSVLQNGTKDLSVGLTSIQNGKATVSFGHVKAATTTKEPAKATNNTAWWLLLLLIPASYYLAAHKDPKRKK